MKLLDTSIPLFAIVGLLNRIDNAKDENTIHSKEHKTQIIEDSFIVQ
jgi:hypothetical protein